jgi:hypothetical protein
LRAGGGGLSGAVGPQTFLFSFLFLFGGVRMEMEMEMVWYSLVG